MPDIKVYIREENISKWRAIANKSEWINTLLKNSDDTSEYGATRDTPAGPMTTVLSETLPEEPIKQTPWPTNDLWHYEGLDLHGYCLRTSNGVVYTTGDDPEPYDGADEEMVKRLKQLGQIWKY